MFDPKIKTYLNRLSTSAQKPSSYLFYGPAGSGKEEAAHYFIMKIAGKVKDLDFLRKMKAGIHPDILIVEPETVQDKKGRFREKEIVVDQVKKAKKSLKFFPYEIKQKFCIIKKAQRLNAEASNALLKLLEEPTANTYLLLLANDKESVLPTIASRCAFLRFTKKYFPLQKEEHRQRLRQIVGASIHEKFSFSEKISKDRNEAVEILGDWEIAAQESLDKLAGREDWGKIEKVIILLKKMRETIDMIEYSNANPRTALENLMLDMEWK